MKEFFVYIMIISIASIVFTIYDKKASTDLKKLRISEDTFMLLSVFGGSLAMYLMMLFIRHKTKHKKFMIGLPIIILLQVISAFFLFYFDII